MSEFIPFFLTAHVCFTNTSLQILSLDGSSGLKLSFFMSNTVCILNLDTSFLNFGTDTVFYHQYKLLKTISNDTEVYEEPVPRTKKIPHIAIKFKADEENRKF